jgi:hypothetical protein
MPYGGKAYNVSVMAVRQIEKFCEYRKLYLITDKKNFYNFKSLNIRELVLVDEETVILHAGFLEIQDYLVRRQAGYRNAGWYFQQFLKMGMSAYEGIAPHYLIWDSDTIMLQPMRFFTDDGKVLMSQSQEHHEPYFRAIKILLGNIKLAPFSFITEHMMVNISFMQELLGKIANGSSLTGDWVWRILDSIEFEFLAHSGFSEFETYGNFVYSYHQDSIMPRKIPSARHGAEIYGLYPNKYDLFRLSKKYQYVSFERRYYSKLGVIFNKFLSRLFYLTQKKEADEYLSIFHDD